MVNIGDPSYPPAGAAYRRCWEGTSHLRKAPIAAYHVTPTGRRTSWATISAGS